MNKNEDKDSEFKFIESINWIEINKKYKGNDRYYDREYKSYFFDNKEKPKNKIFVDW